MSEGFAARLARYAGRAAIGAAMVAYPLLAYYTTTAPAEGGFGAIVLAAAPLAGAALLVAWRTRWRIPALVLCGVAFGVLWRYSVPIRQHLPLVYFIQHAGTNLALLVLFGRTLAPGRMPLCSRFAAAVRGPLDAPVARYTRQVTVAWTVFFAAMTLISSALFAFASTDVWSAFANLVTLPLLILMFVVEYTVRLRVLPDIPHTSIMSAVRAFRQGPGISAPPPQ